MEIFGFSIHRHKYKTTHRKKNSTDDVWYVQKCVFCNKEIGILYINGVDMFQENVEVVKARMEPMDRVDSNCTDF